MGGLEPPSSCFLHLPLLGRALPLSYTAFHIYFLDQGSCRCQTLPKILGYSLMTYSEPRSICFVLFNIRIPAAHSAFILSHHSLGLTLLPSRLILCISGPTRGRCEVRNLPCRLRLYLRIGYRLFPLLQLVGLFRCRFDSIHVQACTLAAVPPQ